MPEERSPFDAWNVPSWAEEPRPLREVPVQWGGEVPGEGIVRFPDLGATDARRLADRLQTEGRETLAGRSAEDIAGVLGRVGRRFLDGGDPLRARALELLPWTAGISEPMAGVILDGMARDWVPERLRELLHTELGDSAVLDGFVARAGLDRTYAVGASLALHTASGSVPGLSVTSLIRSLLVKSPLILKPGQGDVALPVLFAEGLAEADPELARAVAVLYWPGGEGGAEDEFLAQVELVVAYGSDDVVRSIRDRLPPHVRLVAYHHRVSVACLGRDNALDALPGVARDLAAAVATFDQRGCVCPHVVYVEEGGALAPREFAAALAAALEAVGETLPTETPDARVGSAILQLRRTFEVRRAAGEDVGLWEGESLSWTVLYEDEAEFRPSCLHRTVWVKPLQDAMKLPEALRSIGDHLQTVALTGFGERWGEVAERLARSGATRITTPGRAPWPPPWWSHDGLGALRPLVRWIDLEA